MNGFKEVVKKVIANSASGILDNDLYEWPPPCTVFLPAGKITVSKI